MTEKYKILSLLGSGGFADVFLAEHRDTGEKVAVKVLRSSDGQERFAREAAILSALKSPYTVRLLEYGRSERGLFMVFEYVAGAEELQAFSERHGPIGWQTTVELLHQILCSLEEAHGLGVVHRDIKPANILLTRDGRIRVLDFGLVRWSPQLHDVTPITATGVVLGTPRYMAPEVLRASELATPSADIFAVGLIGYQLLTGKPANPGRSPYEVIARHIDPAPYELPDHIDVPFAIRAWIDAMMRKESRRRTPDAATALRELDERLGETPGASALFQLEGRADLRGLQPEPLPHPTPAAEAREPRLGTRRLQERLGRGATSTVWAAHDEQTGAAAAVKILLAGAAPPLRTAFLAEARALASLTHPHIVRLLDYGHVTAHDVPPDDADAGDPYIVMELALGTLRDRGLPTTWSATRDLLLQVLDALAYAHARGVIHRDLKPENVLVTSETHYKVTDFGIAHSLRARTRTTAETLAESIGTPRYMSPEQFRGHSYDYGPATDLYALGCMAFELVSGATPFLGPRLVDIAQQHESAPVPALAPRFPVPDGLEGWLARLLAKRPEDRFEAAADAAWQLRQLADGFADGGKAAEASFSGPFEPTVVTDLPGEARLDVGAFLTVLDPVWQDEAPPTLPTARAEPITRPVTQAPFDPPPPLTSWRQEPVSGELQAQGLGLFALRELPLAGQQAARDALWEALLRVQERRTLLPVVLRGQPGGPVTQLGSWFAAHANEVGAAHPVFMTHTLGGAPREGLVGMLEDIYGTWATPDDQAAELIRRRVAEAPGGGEAAATDARILAQEVLRARGSRVGSASSEHERFVAISRVLRRLARRRPLVIFVDHIEHSGESVAFLRYLIEEQPDLAAVVVIGYHGASSRPAVDRDLAALVGDARCRLVAVAPYDAREFTEFAAMLLPLDAALVDLLAAATERDPVMTQLAIADLIDRGLLERHADIFAPTRRLERAEMAPRAVVTRRLARLDLERGARQALRVCAILGEAPDLGEAAAVCARMGVALPDALGARLEDVGLAHSSGGRWWFTRGVIEHLLADVPQTEQRQIRRECGHAALARTAPDDAEGWARAARYFREAGAGADALEPLYRAARLLVTRDLETAEALIAERGALIAMLALGAESTAWIDQLNLLSVVAKTRGDRKAAVDHMAAAEELAAAQGYSRGLARALRDSAAVAVDLGNLGEATARFDRAAAISAESGDALDEAHAWFGAGFVEYRRGNLAAAEERYRAAIDRFEQVGAQQGRARAMSYLSAVYVAGGRFDDAQQVATQAQEVARDCGALAIVAETKSDLAEIARFKGDYELARQLYEETAHWQELAGSRSIGAITTLNLALVDLGAGHYDAAMRSLETLERDVRELGLSARLPLIRIARLAAMVGAGVAAEAEEMLRQSGELLAVSEPDRDIAWAYECGVHAAAANPARRAWFRKHAVREYERLGDAERARAVPE